MVKSTYRVMILGDGEEADDFAAELEKAEYRCAKTADARTALREIVRIIPDCIIITVPFDTDGLRDFLMMVKKSVKTRLVPVIVAGDDDGTTRMRAIELGIDAFVPRPVVTKELIATVAGKLSRYREFYLLSVTDELTNLFNRRELISRFDDYIRQEISPVSVAIMDIDFFKKVNDMYGHQTGDTVLASFSATLSARGSERFVPARFGGEEFVVLMPDVGADDAKDIIDELRSEFTRLVFTSTEGSRTFSVNFSAGVAEFPTMADSVSSVLSRADQALYAAKREGRERTYIFRSIMSRDDRFWSLFQEKHRGLFINAHNADSVTGLPFIPEAFERIAMMPFAVETIGIIVIRISPLFDVSRHGGYQNHHYDIENVANLIVSSCEYHLPTDMIAAVTDPADNEFCMLFPTAEELPISEAKFTDVYLTIIRDINFSLIPYNVTMSASCGVMKYDKRYPRQLYARIAATRHHAVMITEGRDDYTSFFRKTVSRTAAGKKGCAENILPVYHYRMSDAVEEYTAFALRGYALKNELFDVMCREAVRPMSVIESFFEMIISEHHGRIRGKLIVPWIPRIGLKSFSCLMGKLTRGFDTVIAIEETMLPAFVPSDLASIMNNFPPGISGLIDNCYLGVNLLNILSLVDVRGICLSPELVRNLHNYRDRVKLIRGIRQFTEQIGLDMGAKGVNSREEYATVMSLGVHHASGHYPDSISKPESKSDAGTGA